MFDRANFVQNSLSKIHKAEEKSDKELLEEIHAEGKGGRSTQPNRDDRGLFPPKSQDKPAGAAGFLWLYGLHVSQALLGHVVPVRERIRREGGDVLEHALRARLHGLVESI